MPVLTIGKTKIPYALLRSGTCERARITVTPDLVEVVVPPTASEDQIAKALNRRRRWIFDETQKMAKLVSLSPRLLQFMSGAKIPFRGRMMRLKVVPTDDTLVHVSYRNGFYIEYPVSASVSSRDSLIEDALRLWLKKKLREDVAAFVRQHGEPNNLKPNSFRIKDQKHIWGSCGQDHVININWHLIFAPKTVLEYAVVHELCHLRHRNHDRSFWRLVRSILPDHEATKSWLEANEHFLAMRKVAPTF
jgi:predicted metal-dependent hydrolase